MSEVQNHELIDMKFDMGDYVSEATPRAKFEKINPVGASQLIGKMLLLRGLKFFFKFLTQLLTCPYSPVVKALGQHVQ